MLKSTQLKRARMKTNRYIHIVREFKALKARKAQISSEQYLKELELLKQDIDAQLTSPALNANEIKSLRGLLKAI